MAARHILLIIVLLMSSLVPAFAKEKKLGTFGAWNAYATYEGGQTVCYMVTVKLIKSIGPSKRATPYLMITDRPIEASKDVISYGAGTNLNSRHGVKIRAGKDVFELFSVRDTAWTRDAQTDHKLTAELIKLNSVQVFALPDKKGSKAITDTFDLKGASSAYTAIAKACGLLENPSKKSVPKKKTVPSKTGTST